MVKPYVAYQVQIQAYIVWIGIMDKRDLKLLEKTRFCWSLHVCLMLDVEAISWIWGFDAHITTQKTDLDKFTSWIPSARDV